jgi:hypothetical protein
MGLLDMLKPPDGYPGLHARPLFSGARPTSVTFGEPAAFRHYLLALALQVAGTKQRSFEETVDHERARLAEARSLVAQLSAGGVFGQNRELTLDAAQAVQSALAVLQRDRGPLLIRRWSSMN